MKSIIKLKENYEFRRAYNRGKSYVTPFFVVYVIKNHYDSIRLGITTGKKLGNAVQRNRAKRVITAAFRQCSPALDDGFDFVIVARTKILHIKSTVVADALMNQLIKSGVLTETITDEKIID